MTPRLTVVSTASEAGYRQYGYRFLQSFADNWPPDVRLIFYTDGWNMPLPPENSCLIEDLSQQSSWLPEFKRRHKFNSEAHGAASGRMGYRWDAVRFAHKVAAINAANLASDADYLLWLDADVITHQPVKNEVWQSWLPGQGKWLSWLDRSPKIINYPECGFLLFNRAHPSHRIAMRTMANWYGHDSIFKLAETHDSFIWQHLVNTLKLPTRSLSGVGYDYLHVLVHSPLGAYLDHCKGMHRKEIGRTPVNELQIKRTEDYWREK